MGLIVMSERDLQRIEVLSKVTEGRTTFASAAHVLALSTMFAIPDGCQSNGYQKRGRKPGRRTDYMNDPIVNAKRELALTRMSAASTQQSGQMTPLPSRPLTLQAAQT
jgi:hypothetical protein